MSGKINFEKSQDLQEKYGAGFYLVDNTTSGTEYILLLNERSGGEQGGSDIDDDDDNSGQETPLFESEDAQKRFNANRATVFQEVYKTGRRSKSNKFVSLKGLKAKEKLREMKSGYEKLDIEFVSKALGRQPEDLIKDMAKNPRLRDNLNDLMNKPISTLRRAFSPKGDTFTRDMLDDTGAKDTIDLIAAVITKFGE